MQSLRSVLLQTRRAPVTRVARTIFGVDKNIKTPDDIEHATGREKILLLLEEKGITDPFHFDTVFKRGKGTKEEPNIVPSFESKRLVGCICEEEATSVNYFWVHLDEPKRCECGHWFKAVEAPDYVKLVADDLKELGANPVVN